jgi:hypothetical protein
MLLFSIPVDSATLLCARQFKVNEIARIFSVRSDEI